MSSQQMTKKHPPQHQETKPGRESGMVPEPLFDDPEYMPGGKLMGKVALITGGDSGIGRAIAVVYAKEGADVVIAYLNEHEDAEKTKRLVEEKGQRCLAIAGDLTRPDFCRELMDKTLEAFGKLDILVNNAAEHIERQNLEDISDEQLEWTFRTNIFPLFYLTKAALPHLKPGSAIINTASVVAYKGSGHLIDYASSKGAVVAFTRSLSEAVLQRGIRVNGVAPGPIWTPLIVSTFSPEDVAEFGTETPMGRAGQPSEVAPCYVFLAARDSAYISGQMLHPNGGRVVNA